MKKIKTVTMLYEGLGFPIRLVNVPMKKVLGEWALDINFNHLQRTVLYALATKSAALTGAELRFIRHYFEMSTYAFAKLFGVTHVAVLKWEKNATRMNFAAETWIRLYILHTLKVPDKEFKKVYLTFKPSMMKAVDTTDSFIEINVEQIAC